MRAADNIVAWGRWVTTGRRGSFRCRVLANSLPKAGTNLLIKALVELPGARRSRTALINSVVPPARRGPPAAVGVDWPVAADAHWIYWALKIQPPGSVLSGHVPYSATMAKVAEAANTQLVVVLRDPRDVAVSFGPFVAARPHHGLHARFRLLTEEQRIQAALSGLPADERGEGLLDLASRVRAIADWTRTPVAHLVRFEDLVGAGGGGDAARQLTALRGIAAHLGLTVSDDELTRIGASLFGGSATFRQGRIGGWQDAFTCAHRRVAKGLLGDLLVDLGYEKDRDW